MLWLYLAISAAFSAGFMTCGLLTWRSREQGKALRWFLKRLDDQDVRASLLRY